MKASELNIKKVLILENEFWDNNKGNYAYMLYNRLVAAGVEFKIIEQAHCKSKEEIITGVMWCDAILFASTFYYEWQVKGVGDLLMKVPVSKIVIGSSMSSSSLVYNMENIWDLKELASMSHHKVYELTDFNYIGDEYVEILESIDMTPYKTKWDKLEAERIHKNHNMPKTGRRIKIGVIQAFGPQWSNLKEGDIVDELDCTTIDPNPARGVWVMGKDEPVKLINDSGFEEFRFADMKAECLTLEFFSKGCSKDKKDSMEIVESWIYNVGGREDANIEHWSIEMCYIIGCEKRHNRQYFFERLTEYRNTYKDFKEPGTDPRIKYMKKAV